MNEFDQGLVHGVRCLGWGESVLERVSFVHDLDIGCGQEVELPGEGMVPGGRGVGGVGGLRVQQGMSDVAQFAWVVKGPSDSCAYDLGVVGGQRGDSQAPMGVGQVNGCCGVRGGQAAALLG